MHKFVHKIIELQDSTSRSQMLKIDVHANAVNNRLTLGISVVEEAFIPHVKQNYVDVKYSLLPVKFCNGVKSTISPSAVWWSKSFPATETRHQDSGGLTKLL